MVSKVMLNLIIYQNIDYTICIGSTPTFLYFDLYLYSAYTVHYVYFTKNQSHMTNWYLILN